MVVMESDSQHDIGGTFSSLHMPNVVRIRQELAHLFVCFKGGIIPFA